jgi:hypothetical protein
MRVWLAVANVIVCTVLLALLGAAWPALDHTLHEIPAFEVSWTKGLSSAYSVPAVLVALVCFAVPLHIQLDRLLGIRRRMALLHMIPYFAKAVGFQPPDDFAARVESRERPLLRDIFYPYASSTKPRIDPHLIHQALTRWLWFWMMLELEFFILIFVWPLYWRREFSSATGLSVLGLLLVPLMVLNHRASIRLAREQIDEIASNATFRDEIYKVLEAL